MVGTISVSRVPARSACLTEELARSPNFLRSDLRALGELSDFGCDDGEAFAVIAGARRFDRGVQGEQIGLVGDVVDDADLAGNALHVVDGLGDGLAAFCGFLGGLGGHAVGDLGVLGVLRDRGGHLFHRGGGFFNRGGLFARRLRQRLGGGRDLSGRIGQVVRRRSHFRR